MHQISVQWATFQNTDNFYLLKVKGKVVPVLQLGTTPWRRIGEWRYSSTHSLTSALDGDEWSASCPSLFTPKGRAPATHWIGGWVGPRAVLDMVVKRKIPSPCQELNHRTLIVQPIAQCYTDWAIMALTSIWGSCKLWVILHWYESKLSLPINFHHRPLIQKKIIIIPSRCLEMEHVDSKEDMISSLLLLLSSPRSTHNVFILCTFCKEYIKMRSR
jgi:hypothetical protein